MDSDTDLGDLQLAIGRMEGTLESLKKAVERQDRELHRMREQITEDARVHREAITTIKEKLPSARKGEVVLWGMTWASIQLWFPAALLSFVLLAATTVASVQWSMVKDLHGEVHEIVGAVGALEKFAAAGGRATDKDVRRLIADMLPFFRCVALRFKERNTGLDIGAPLSDPDKVTRDAIKGCAEDLPAQLKLLEHWDVAG